MNPIIFLIYLAQFVFLLPVKDRRSRRLGFPWMTLSLVILNTLIHLWVIFLISRRPGSFSEAGWRLLYPYMEVPQLILQREGLGALSVLTSGFLHGGWLHLLGNMFILWFFGRKVEDATGPFRFALFYLLCLFTSGLLSVAARGLFSPAEAGIPGLGASGAIFGVMTAYLFLYADERILTFILPIPWPFWLPVWVYIVRDLLLNALVAELVQTGAVFVTVNIFAHLGGAAGGLFFIYFFLHPEVFAQRR
ncbi:MAG TPA: rhomboid family intramembrane serine protease [Anaerolineae bacterium]|nr:rhomboid family intramembrane serine protease [Anaerolineae bacterium]